jgi:hypothetical protein
MVKTYVRPPPMFVKGEGMYLWDVENRKYLDFTAGIAVNALGHCDPEISKIIAQQVSKIYLTHPTSPSDSPLTGKNPHAHLEPLPQPLDRRPLPNPHTKDRRIRLHARCLRSLRLQLRHRSERSRDQVRAESRQGARLLC